MRRAPSGMGRALSPAGKPSDCTLLTQLPKTRTARRDFGLLTRCAKPRCLATAAQFDGRALIRSLQRAGLDFQRLEQRAARDPTVAAWPHRLVASPASARPPATCYRGWCGQVSLPPAPERPAAAACCWRKPARSLAWLPLQRGPSTLTAYVDFLDRLTSTWPAKPVHLLLHGIDVATARTGRLAAAPPGCLIEPIARPGRWPSRQPRRHCPP